MTRPEINVTPLIDVLLVLLIIFMIVTPVKPSAFKAKVPAEPRRDHTPDPHPDTLIVIVGEDGSLRVNREPASATVSDTGPITRRLIEIFSIRAANYERATLQSFPRNVFIKAPRQLDYGSVAKVVDAVKLSGADPIALQIDELK